MVFKYTNFVLSEDFLNANPGSPLCFDFLSSASSSPQACNNCLGRNVPSVRRSNAPAARQANETRETQDPARVGLMEERGGQTSSWMSCFICFSVGVMEARSGQISSRMSGSEGTGSGSVDNQVGIVREFVAV